jgi:hypothetical protein
MGMIPCLLVIAEWPGGDAGDPQLHQRHDFALLGEGVAAAVAPGGEAAQLCAGQSAVAVDIQRGELLVAVLPEHPPGDRAEELAAGGDAAGVLRVPDQGSSGS